MLPAGHVDDSDLSEVSMFRFSQSDVDAYCPDVCPVKQDPYSQRKYAAMISLCSTYSSHLMEFIRSGYTVTYIACVLATGGQRNNQ